MNKIINKNVHIFSNRNFFPVAITLKSNYTGKLVIT